MNLTLFSPFPRSERPLSISHVAWAVTIKSTMRKKKWKYVVFVLRRGIECTLAWLMEQSQAIINEGCRAVAAQHLLDEDIGQITAQIVSITSIIIL